MTEILTESFCERCGTRYTFESAKPRVRLKGVKVLSRGLKNFVLSDDTSIDEAMAAARSEADREASAHQLDAFHKTFNFCMSCRQYTCPNCWNEAEARCLSCAPLSEADLAPRFADLRELRDATLIAEPDNGAAVLGDEVEAAAWAGFQTPADTLAETASSVDEPAAAVAESVQVEQVDAPEGVATTANDGPESPDVTADEEGVADAGDWVADDGDAAGKAVSQTLGLLQRFRPGQSLDAELDAYERERDEVAATEGEAETPAATDDLAALQADRIAAAARPVDPDALAAAAPLEEPVPTVASDAVAEPVTLDAGEVVAEREGVEPSEALEEPLAAAPPEEQPEPVPALEQPAVPPIAATAASDVVEQPTWRITAPDPGVSPALPPSDGAPVPLQASGAPARPATGDPQWPAKPEWPASTAAAGLPFLGRPATPQGGIEALWAASNQELVTTQPVPGKAAASGIQPCISCGLSLSATARFCRRCGTLQSR